MQHVLKEQISFESFTLAASILINRNVTNENSQTKAVV